MWSLNWVLHAACSSLRRWLDLGLREIPLSVNLPASSLTDTRLLDQLDGLMQHYGLNPSSLMLELTETMLMRDVSSAIDVLGRLKRLPMDELKLDRAFVTDVARGGRDSAIAAAVITLGSELGLQVVAEGVETVEQSAFLLARGCALQQGYLFSRPVPQSAFEQMLKAGSPRAFEAVATARPVPCA